MRILHTMLRVGDLEASVAFYTQVLGMTELRRKDYPEGRFTNVFVGYQPESEGAAMAMWLWPWTTCTLLVNVFGKEAGVSPANRAP
jgi:lactoylglutathione lyase